LQEPRGTYRAQRLLAGKEAEAFAKASRKEKWPELYLLYVYAANALVHAKSICVMSRTQERGSPKDFVLQEVRLSEYVDRLRDYPGLRGHLEEWPKNPGTAIAWFAGRSALEVVIKFTEAIWGAVVFGRGESACHGATSYDSLQVSPECDLRFGEWHERAMNELCEQTIPKPDVWPSPADIHKECEQVLLKLEDEYNKGEREAEKKAAETEQENLQQIIETLKNFREDKDFEAAKLTLPPIAETYDVLCKSRKQCGAKRTDIIRWLGSAAKDGSGYYPALLEKLASPEVIAELDKWQEKALEIEQGNKDTKRELVNATKPTAPTRYERYLMWVKENKLISIGLVVVIFIIGFGHFTDALKTIRDFWLRPNLSSKQESKETPPPNKDLGKRIVVASAAVEVKIRSDLDINGVAHARAHLAFVKGEKPLLLTSSMGYTARQTGNGEVVYKAKLDMDAKDSAVGNPVSYLRDADYILIEFGRMPSDSNVLGGDVVCIINNSVRLEFSIPPQRLVNKQIFIRDVSESLEVLNESGN
jgi:hypothetical protein